MHISGFASGGLNLLVIGAALTCAAQEFDQGPVFGVIEENDFVVNTDRHYTQGIKLSYLGADGRVPGFARWISERVATLGFEKKTEKFGYELGQNIYTPAHIRATQLLLDDRPYGGWLYGGLVLQRRGLAANRWLSLDHFQLDVGIIGPEALGEDAQNWVHRVRGFEEALGWDHQLETEPGVALKYQRSWLLTTPLDRPRWFDLIPHAGASVGNVDTSLRAGLTFRAGWNLPEDFGFQTIDSLGTLEGGWSESRTMSRWGVYGFGSLEGRAVFYSTFLDGNLFHNSHHVEKEILTGDFRGGIVLVLRRIELALTYIFRTPEFIGQTEDDSFGSFAFKYKF
jgi:lipid A 3-O-deacylase